MLHVAAWSQSRSPWTGHSDSILFEYIAIFLVLHVPDNVGRPSSPSTSYETYWPVQDSENINPTSPSSSPVQSHRKHPTSPSSPKSPRNSPNAPPSSPNNKRSYVTNTRSSPCRSTAQNLHSIRNKMPSLLRALCADDVHNSSDLSRYSNELDISKASIDFMISKRAIDCLGLIFAGGPSKDHQVRSFIIISLSFFFVFN